jgi:hypothetical protein
MVAGRESVIDLELLRRGFTKSDGRSIIAGTPQCFQVNFVPQGSFQYYELKRKRVVPVRIQTWGEEH